MVDFLGLGLVAECTNEAFLAMMGRRDAFPYDAPLMNRLLPLLVVVLLAAPCAAQAQTEEEARAFLGTWCSRCHSGADPEAGLSVESGLLLPQDLAALAQLAAARDRVRTGEMPPPGEDAPSALERARFADWATRSLFASARLLSGDPGRVTVRRLSRREYQNTVRDLLGVDATAVAATFPADDLGYGFDNIGDALSFSLLHLEKYEAAAATLAQEALSIEDPSRPTVRKFEAESMETDLEGAARGSHATLYTNAELSQSLSLPRPGEYIVKVRAYATQAGPDIARMEVRLGDFVKAVEVKETADKPGLHEFRVKVREGDTALKVAFVNDYYDPKNPDASRRDRNLIVDSVDVVGPVDPVPPTFGQTWILAKDPGRGSVSARARPMIKEILRRAWRRPPTGSEVTRFVELVVTIDEEDHDFLLGIRAALEAALVSPNFLFRWEPGGVSRADDSADLYDEQLAVRLSYFLWSSMPDEQLVALAAKKKLRDLDVLKSEAKRLLAHERAEALATDFAGQWFEIRDLVTKTPDKDQFPEFDDALRQSMARETELLFLHVLKNKRPLRELVVADYTFVNPRLARHYSLPGVEGDEFRKLAVPRPLGGLLGQAGILTVTSGSTRTSPVKRGKWILENLLDAPPAAPPPGADSFGEGDVSTTASLRTQMEQHRARTECAACHIRMDALGLAMERFDPIGRHRLTDASGAIDNTSTLPDGRSLAGVESLRTLVVSDPGFLRGVAKKLFVYAVGREPTIVEALQLEESLSSLGSEATLEDVIIRIISHEGFRKRRSG